MRTINCLECGQKMEKTQEKDNHGYVEETWCCDNPNCVLTDIVITTNLGKEWLEM